MPDLIRSLKFSPSLHEKVLHDSTSDLMLFMFGCWYKSVVVLKVFDHHQILKIKINILRNDNTKCP